MQAFRDAPELLRGCFVVGEVATLRRAAASVLRPGEPLVPLAVLDHPSQAWEAPPRCVPLWPVPDLPGPQPWGQVSALAGQAAGQCVQWAARAALRGEVAALVTAPLHKEALAAAGGFDIAFVIGGAELYRQALPLADRLLLTEIDRAYEGDAFFPDFDRSTWREASRDARTAESGLPFAFVTYQRAG